MAITYDGDSIINRPPVQFDRYREWRRFQDGLDDATIRREEDRRKSAAMSVWLSYCPVAYRKATVKSITVWDRASGLTMKDAVLESVRTGRPVNLVIRADRQVKAKTWAAYAYVSALIKQGVITDPDTEVLFTTEMELVDGISNFRKRDQLMAGAFRNGERKLIVIDNVGSTSTYKESTVASAWDRITEECERNGTSVILIRMSRKDIWGRIADRNTARLATGAAEVTLTDKNGLRPALLASENADPSEPDYTPGDDAGDSGPEDGRGAGPSVGGRTVAQQRGPVQGPATRRGAFDVTEAGNVSAGRNIGPKPTNRRNGR